MKTLSVTLVACLFVAALGYPQPDQDIKLADAHSHLNEITNDAPKKEPLVTSNQGTQEDRTRLMADLLTKYNKRVNPDNVKVAFGVNLLDFRVNQERNALETFVWLRYQWEDSRLEWTPSDYGGVEVLRIDPNALWKPDITLYNSVDPVNMINCYDTNTLVYPNGNVLFIPPCKMTSQCNLTLKKLPYGNQECSLKFGSWTFDGNVLDVQLYNGTNSMDLSQMHNSSGFEVVSSTAVRNIKYYPCCADPYPDLTFNVTIKRIPGEELFLKL